MQSFSLARAAESLKRAGANGHATVTVPGTRRFPTESNNRTYPQLPAMEHRPAPELLLTRSGFWESRFRSFATARTGDRHDKSISTDEEARNPASFGPESRSIRLPGQNRDGSLAAGAGLAETPRVTR